MDGARAVRLRLIHIRSGADHFEPRFAVALLNQTGKRRLLRLGAEGKSGNGQTENSEDVAFH
jgi:hypothetical protein